jgi:carbonic anhydrase
MRKLIQGIQRFQNSEFHPRKQLFQQLADGQEPLALFITCSDSRIDPNLLTQTEPGELFVMRNAGNIVPPYSSTGSSEAATIEYAVSVLKVQDIIICGHSQCGAMGGLLAPDSLNGLDAVKEALKHAAKTEERVRQRFGDLADEARLNAAVEQNVLVQLEHLRTHPSVMAAVESGELGLNGWTYAFETGEVRAYDPQQEQFRALQDVAEVI